ncbi:unnamed protein product [Haemonchus placei]|uniref:Sperm protamine P1 family protein n=1 Tax=Haemonchus placei TaxID=6290 RepID=A0A0N4X1G6_HAEPC|nr:unnamed protein product [Haemonchus placei]
MAVLGRRRRRGRPIGERNAGFHDESVPDLQEAVP